ncbi:hypothetical protein WR25_19171 [Diploscapter pachys]|uniref:Uncharacterized protein n=1 Tax=Diploscapter pachys TaxID=2018661 RepID=A0A2A2JFE7_9BILA|nr:hypothetical protein WR25_19171 [Diploscapter pachys]
MSAISDTSWLLLSSPIILMAILIVFSSMGVWIEKEAVKRRRIQQEREERLSMLKKMSAQQTGEFKQ